MNLGSLRLAMLRAADKKYDEAISILKEVTEVDKENIKAWLILGNVYLKSKDYRSARKSFENVLANVSKHDSYALCSLGNWNIWVSRHDVKNVCFRE